MILLSRLIKGTGWAPPVQTEKKIIAIKILETLNQKEDSDFTPIDTEKQKQTMINEAEMQAESIISQAQHKAEMLLKQIEVDRQAFEVERAEIAEQARNTGFSQGLEDGRQQGYHCLFRVFLHHICNNNKSSIFSIYRQMNQGIVSRHPSDDLQIQ